MIGQGRVSESSSTGSNTPRGCSNSQVSEREEIVTTKKNGTNIEAKERRKKEKRQKSRERHEKQEKEERGSTTTN